MESDLSENSFASTIPYPETMPDSGGASSSHIPILPLRSEGVDDAGLPTTTTLSESEEEELSGPFDSARSLSSCFNQLHDDRIVAAMERNVIQKELCFSSMDDFFITDDEPAVDHLDRLTDRFISNVKVAASN